MSISITWSLQVQLTTELSAATAQLAAMQLELGGARQLEAELKSQLATVSAEAQNNSQEWDTSRRQLEGILYYCISCVFTYLEIIMKIQVLWNNCKFEIIWNIKFAILMDISIWNIPTRVFTYFWNIQVFNYFPLNYMQHIL